MALNPSIILQGQGVQPVNALAQGAQAGQMINDIQRTQAQRDMYQEHGAGIAQGNQQSLNALAAFDPQAALGVKNTQLGMDNTRQGMQARAQQMKFLSAQEQRAIEQHAASLSTTERAAESEKLQGILNGAAFFHSKGDEAGYQNYLQQNGVDAANPEYAFQNFPATAARYGEVLETLQSFNKANEPYQPQSPLGKFFADQAQGAIPAGMAPPQSGVNVTTNVGGNPDVFQDELDKRSASMFTTLYDNLPAAQAKIGAVDNLSSLLEETPTGAGAAVKSWLGSFGIATEGLSEIQAVEAAISQMVPAQRMPGSGPMSDADLALFKLSLPRLINTPDGNKRIIQTMRGLAEYEAAQSRIAAQVVSAELTRTEGQNALMSLPNPLAAFREGEQSQPNEPPQAGAVVDGYRFKGGDPSQQSSWEPI